MEVTCYPRRRHPQTYRSYGRLRSAFASLTTAPTQQHGGSCLALMKKRAWVVLEMSRQYCSFHSHHLHHPQWLKQHLATSTEAGLFSLANGVVALPQLDFLTSWKFLGNYLKEFRSLGGQ